MLVSILGALFTLLQPLKICLRFKALGKIEDQQEVNLEKGGGRFLGFFHGQFKTQLVLNQLLKRYDGFLVGYGKVNHSRVTRICVCSCPRSRYLPPGARGEAAESWRHVD